jgi:hypothetical protein
MTRGRTHQRQRRVSRAYHAIRIKPMYFPFSRLLDTGVYAFAITAYALPGITEKLLTRSKQRYTNVYYEHIRLSA